MSFSNPPLKRLASIFLQAEVRPKRGAIVYRKLGPAEHSGIFIADQKIVQLSGTGNIEFVDYRRFCGTNPFNQIYVACDDDGQVLHSEAIAARAERTVGQYRNYNLVLDNCHQFSAGCVTGDFENSDNFFVFLERSIEEQFGVTLEWRYISSNWQ
jgi:hypothetical protein